MLPTRERFSAHRWQPQPLRNKVGTARVQKSIIQHSLCERYLVMGHFLFCESTVDESSGMQ